MAEQKNLKYLNWSFLIVFFSIISKLLKYAAQTKNLIYKIQHFFTTTRLSGRFAPIFYFNFKHVLFAYIVKRNQKKSWTSKLKKKSYFFWGKFLKIRSSMNLPGGHVRSHKKIGPTLFIRFDVYWIQTDDKIHRHRVKQHKVKRHRLKRQGGQKREKW